MRRVAVLAFPHVVPFDLATPCEVFSRVTVGGSPAYVVEVCGAEPKVDAGWFTIADIAPLERVDHADLVLVPGQSRLDVPVEPRVLAALRRAAARGAVVASICAGAFVLGAAGLLDGRGATTHWLATDELARRFPRARVDPRVLFVDEGNILTSAGAAAGLDLCLHLVRREFGAAAAADAARHSVMPLERPGGQAQFIRLPDPPPDGTPFSELLAWVEVHLPEPISVAQIARRAGMSDRTLHRHFRERTGLTPLQWLLRARVQRARALLETTASPVERIAEAAGFGQAVSMREAFRKAGLPSPLAYRRAFMDPRGSRPPPHESASSGHQEEQAHLNRA